MSTAPCTLALILGLATTTFATAQSTPASRWRDAPDGYYGLHLGGGLYGRIGSALKRPAPATMGAPDAAATGAAFGVGLRWDWSPNASATLGFDSYDDRLGGGERDSVRATSLGLQWRY